MRKYRSKRAIAEDMARAAADQAAPRVKRAAERQPDNSAGNPSKNWHTNFG